MASRESCVHVAVDSLDPKYFPPKTDSYRAAAQKRELTPPQKEARRDESLN